MCCSTARLWLVHVGLNLPHLSVGQAGSASLCLSCVECGWPWPRQARSCMRLGTLSKPLPKRGRQQAGNCRQVQDT